MKKTFFISLFLGLLAVLSFFQNCSDVGISRFASSSEEPVTVVAAKLLSGTFCHPFDKALVSPYKLSDFYVLNLTAGKFDGQLYPDNDIDGRVDKALDYSDRGTAEISPIDSDQDGIPDFVEKIKGLNPNRADANEDGVDLDGLINRRELQLGTDPNFKGDEPVVSYSVKAVNQTAGCGAGQTAYHYDIDRILLAPTQPFTDPVNSGPYSLSHALHENIIFVMAKLSPEDVRKPSVFIGKFFKVNADNIVALDFQPPEFYIIGESVEDCPTCNVGGAGTIYSKIYSGAKHSCAIASTNDVICWGENSSGQLGDGTVAPRVSPVNLKLDEQVSELALGESHSCAITFAQDVYCWGANSFGQLGINSAVDSVLPVKVDLGAGAMALHIAAGAAHTCAVLQDNTMKCWGLNNGYQLGTGTTANSLVPVLAVTTGVVYPIAHMSAAGNNTCMTGVGGQAYCWGKISGCVQNTIGRVPTTCMAGGTFPSEGIRLTASWNMMVTNGWVNTGVDRTPLGQATCFGSTIFTGGQSASGCGIQADGGQPPDTPPSISTEFTDGILRILKVTMGVNHSCAIYQRQPSTGSLVDTLDCWGENNTGALGQTVEAPTLNTTPTTVSEIIQPKDVSSGNGFTCAIDKDGVIWCWGINTAGQLASGNITNNPVPTKIKNQ